MSLSKSSLSSKPSTPTLAASSLALKETAEQSKDFCETPISRTAKMQGVEEVCRFGKTWMKGLFKDAHGKTFTKKLLYIVEREIS